MAEIGDTDVIEFGGALSLIAVGEQNGAAPSGDSWAASYNWTSSYHAIQQSRSLAIYPKEVKTCPTNTCTQMFRAALSIIATTWRLPRGPSAGEINCRTSRQCSTIFSNLEKLVMKP